MEKQKEGRMNQLTDEEIVKIQAKGLITLPKKLRKGLIDDGGLVRVKKEQGRLVIEPVRTLPYPVRSYTDEEVAEFLKLDEQETRSLKAKVLL